MELIHLYCNLGFNFKNLSWTSCTDFNPWNIILPAYAVKYEIIYIIYIIYIYI